MKEIPLTQGKFAIVDDDDYQWLMQWKWCAMKTKSTYYAVRNEKKNEIRVGMPRGLVKMHREILGLSDNEDFDVDHKNGNGVDNRKENLRICTHAENMRNTKVNNKNTTGFKGVSWNKENRKYIAKIEIDGRTKYLGSFDTAIEAALCYDENAVSIFGEYARLNFPIF